MSYILDALRKSDQLRRRSGAPTLLLGQAEAATAKQPALFLYALIALVLLGAGVAIGWLRPWQQVPPAAAPAAQAGILPAPQQQQDAKHSLPSAPAAPAPVIAAAPEPAPPPAPAHAPVQAQGAANLKTVKPATPPKALASGANKAEALVQDQFARGDGAAASKPLAEVLAMAELPLAIQQELPSMSISVHAYSSKARERLVGINGRLLHEGENAAPGLKLEQITPDGMILSYKGYTFRRGVH